MEQYTNVVVLRTWSGELVIRPRKDGEVYPSHRPVRIVLDSIAQGSTIHLVQGGSPVGLKIEHHFEPENNWRKCPCCKTKEWAAWRPVQSCYREVARDGSWSGEHHSVTWYIVCIHCASFITAHHGSPYSDSTNEYVYDPADDKPMRWAIARK